MTRSISAPIAVPSPLIRFPLLALLALGLLGVAPRRATAQGAAADTAAPRPWYERISLRGYAQFRYNRLLETNPQLRCEQCDRSIGEDGGFFIRRARLVFSGQVHPRVSVYIQPDLATSVSGSGLVLQIRDLYADVALNDERSLWLRIGESKVPWGFENLQSSSNRLPLDRDDAINSGIPNERDLGVIAMWAPTEIRRRFRILTDSGLKGSGDYGMVAVGAMNGQSANRAEANDSRHVIARVSYPFRFPSGQFLELGVQGYTGRWVPLQRSPGVGGPREFDDERVAVSAILYPQPFGLQAEWMTGRGPRFVPGEGRIADRAPLSGGYVQAMVRTQPAPGHQLIPYVRAQWYDGGKKQELDARSYDVRELELGAEWLPFSAFELTAAYVISDRRFEDAANPDNRQKGQFLRLQAQVNY